MKERYNVIEIENDALTEEEIKKKKLSMGKNNFKYF